MAAENQLIVPVISPFGTVYFASVSQNATAQDVIDSLIRLQDVRDEILGDLPDEGWDLQMVRKEEAGRVWEEDELEASGSGELNPKTDLLKLGLTTIIFRHTLAGRSHCPPPRIQVEALSTRTALFSLSVNISSPFTSSAHRLATSAPND